MLFTISILSRNILILFIVIKFVSEKGCFIQNFDVLKREPFFNLAFFFSLENNSRAVICCCRYCTLLSLFTGKVFYKQITRLRRVFSKKRKRNSYICAMGLIIRFRNNFERTPHVVVLGGGACLCLHESICKWKSFPTFPLCKFKRKFDQFFWSRVWHSTIAFYSVQ